LLTDGHIKAKKHHDPSRT